jgi:hypothetical protein
MYKPYTKKWTHIYSFQTLIGALHIGFDPVPSSTILGNKIFIRSLRNGIVFDVESSAWSPFPLNLLNYWWNDASIAVVVQNLLITCHREYNKDVPKHEINIWTYNPEIDAWIKLEGLEIFFGPWHFIMFHGDAYRSDFMTMNGKLVIYHMWDIDHLRFSVIEIN